MTLLSVFWHRRFIDPGQSPLFLAMAITQFTKDRMVPGITVDWIAFQNKVLHWAIRGKPEDFIKVTIFVDKKADPKKALISRYNFPGVGAGELEVPWEGCMSVPPHLHSSWVHELEVVITED